MLARGRKPPWGPHWCCPESVFAPEKPRVEKSWEHKQKPDKIRGGHPQRVAGKKMGG